MFLEAIRMENGHEVSLSRRVNKGNVKYIVRQAKSQGFTVYVDGVEW